jgi:class 3 adenylate cyclase
MASGPDLRERPRRWPWLPRPSDLGAFSPVATLRTYTPGARALLEEAARDAERGLHVVRGLLLAVVSTIFFVFQARDAPVVIRWLAPAAVPVIAALWLLVWRALRRQRPPRWLPYVLVCVDAWLALRGPVATQTPLYNALGFDRFLTRADLAAMGSVFLALVAVSGSFRLDPRVALWSSLVAVLSYAYIAVALAVPRNQATLVGGVIAFTGLLGVMVARAFRYLMLKAREQGVLERYVPEALMVELARSGDPIGIGRDADITVLLIDIRGYARRAERLTPRETVAFLNDYFSVVVAPLAAENAVLDKYIGDGVFAFFEGDGHQRRAMRAARAVLAALERYNRARPDVEPVAVGMGLHTGRALVGTIGAEQKREYTAIADAVNLAARLEELNKVYGASIVASEAVLQAVEAALREGFVGPEVTPIRGHEAPLAVRYLPARR